MQPHTTKPVTQEHNQQPNHREDEEDKKAKAKPKKMKNRRGCAILFLVLFCLKKSFWHEKSVVYHHLVGFIHFSSVFRYALSFSRFSRTIYFCCWVLCVSSLLFAILFTFFGFAFFFSPSLPLALLPSHPHWMCMEVFFKKKRRKNTS